MQKVRFLLLLLLLCSCASVSREEIALIRDAQSRLTAAKSVSDKINADSVKLFKDKLVAKSLEAIDQAALDEISKASRDGLTEDEAKAIEAQASGLRTKAIADIEAAYAAVNTSKAKEDYEQLYQIMVAYWTGRLGVDEQNAILLETLGRK